MNEHQEEEGKQLWKEKGELAYWAKMALSMEKARVAPQVRLAHFAKVKRESPDTIVFLGLVKEAEKFADDKLAELIVIHSTWEWASRIKGIGLENYPKVVGLIEKFGRYYEVNDSEIPSYVNRTSEKFLTIVKGKVVEKVGIWVKGIERLENISKLRKYAGLSVNAETGEIQKKRKGQTLDYNSELRMALYRIGVSLMRAKGIWYYGGKKEGCSRGYKGCKDKIERECKEKGIKIITTPKGRVCPECDKTIAEKATFFCPTCGEKLIGKKEPEGYLFEGHLHMKALMRGMMKDFCTCMWLVWREAEGLPVTSSYEGDKLSHRPLNPWAMIDKL